MATPTSAWASAGASLVPSPVMATRCPRPCSSRMRDILSSGVAWARKSLTPASAAMAAAVRRLSPVIITVRMPIWRSSVKRCVIPTLTTSLRWITPRACASRATTSGVPPGARHHVDRVLQARRERASPAADPGLDGVGGALADARAIGLNAAHARLCAEGDELEAARDLLPLAEAEALLGEHDDGAALGGLVGQGGELGRVGQVALGDPVRRDELRRLAVAERDGAGLVQEEGVHVARGLDRAPAHREHVALHEAVHAGDADRRQEGPDRGGDERHEEGDEDRQRHLAARVA